MKIGNCAGRWIFVFVLFFFGSIGAKGQLWVEDFLGETDGVRWERLREHRVGHGQQLRHQSTARIWQSLMKSYWRNISVLNKDREPTTLTFQIER